PSSEAHRVSVAEFFFFQAEDGIRGFHVTGVQTCALPISGAGRKISVSVITTWHKEPLNNSAQLCASLSGLQSTAANAENGESFSSSPTPLCGPESRALRG